MAFSDWEVVYGTDYEITEERAVHGTHSIKGCKANGACGMVYKPTYNDAPLNAEIRTWASLGALGSQDTCLYYIGMIARKQQGVNTYVESYLEIQIDHEGFIGGGEVVLQTVRDGSQDLLAGEDVTSKLQSILGSHTQKWFWFKIKIYSIGDQLYSKAYITPYIDNPDVNNPPENQLQLLAEVEITPEPDYLKSGGACGILFGNDAVTDSWGDIYVDWTEIWY